MRQHPMDDGKPPCDLVAWLAQTQGEVEALLDELRRTQGEAIEALLNQLRQEWMAGPGAAFRDEQPREEAESCQVMTQ